MADRFPTIEDFDEGDTEVKAKPGDEGGDTAGEDFLARERAALGDDADQFAQPSDRAATVEDGDGEGDLLGGDEPDGETAAFQSSFPPVDTSNDQVAPGGSITGPTQPAPTYSSYAEPEEEPEVIKQWRERRDLALQHRADTAAAKKAETVKAAQAAIDDFYENYNNKKDKSIAQTRREADAFLAAREDTSSGGTSWERIAKLVDLSGKGPRGGAAGSEKERFRELLTSLRKDEHAPGAAGV